MSSISTSLNSLLASNFSSVGRAELQKPGDFQREVTATFGQLKPGTTLSARTDYTVNARGVPVARNTTITVGDATEESQQQQNRFFAPPQDRAPQSFADLQKPKPNLTPTDEAALFDADTVSGEDGASQSRNFFMEQGAEDENGDAVQVEIIAPREEQPTAASLEAQRQRSVSHLYARNNELAYAAEPVLQFAA